MIFRPRVILTGSSGRTGRALRRLRSSDWDIRPYSRSREAGRGIGALEELLTGRDAMEGDAIVHAAWSVVPATAEQAEVPGPDLALLGKLLERCRGAEAPPLFIFLSTGAVYGEAGERARREDDLAAPKGRYAAGKLEAEEMIRASGLPHAILRISNLYGIPSRPDDPQGVIGKLLYLARTGGVFTRWGPDSRKDYLHGADFAGALDEVIRRRLEGRWNLASGEAVWLSELIGMVEGATGKPIRVDQAAGVPWDVRDNRIDPGAFREATGWKAEIRLKEWLERESV
jgi:nucleoside-diphosphate-sugar epimerase